MLFLRSQRKKNQELRKKEIFSVNVDNRYAYKKAEL